MRSFQSADTLLLCCVLSDRWCEAVEESAMAAVLHGCSGSGDSSSSSSLRVLQCRCLSSAMTQDAMSHICHMGQLARLDLGRCDELTDLATRCLAEAAPALTHINLEWCTEITGTRDRWIYYSHLQPPYRRPSSIAFHFRFLFPISYFLVLFSVSFVHTRSRTDTTTCGLYTADII